MRFIEPPKSPEQETITMKQTLIRSLALLISAVMLIGLIPTAISAKEPATVKASGPLTLITEIAPVPGTVAGAHIVSSFLMYIFKILCKITKYFT